MERRDITVQSSLLDLFHHYASGCFFHSQDIDPSNPERLTLAGVIRFYDILCIDVETVSTDSNGDM